jgi:DNA-directed RNA polymerase omega subunit
VEKLDFIDSKFRFAILAAKRAKQLVGGARKKVDTTFENPLSIAIEEVIQRKVKFRILEEDEQIMYNGDNSALLLGSEDEEQENNTVDDLLYEEKFSDKFDDKYEDEEEDDDKFDDKLDADIDDKYDDDDSEDE